MVDAALAGLYQGESSRSRRCPMPPIAVLPGCRQKLMPNLSLSVPAARYRARAAA